MNPEIQQYLQEMEERIREQMRAMEADLHRRLFDIEKRLLLLSPPAA